MALAEVSNSPLEEVITAQLQGQRLLADSGLLIGQARHSSVGRGRGGTAQPLAAVAGQLAAAGRAAGIIFGRVLDGFTYSKGSGSKQVGV